MYPVLFEIGPINIYSLGVFWAAGALAAVWIFQAVAQTDIPAKLTVKGHDGAQHSRELKAVKKKGSSTKESQSKA
jgi:hypothetical protein